MKYGDVSGFQARFGNACGSASLLRLLEGKMYFLTNAHVVGTVVGRACQIIGLSSLGSPVVVQGSIFAAAYLQGKSVDWAIVVVEGSQAEQLLDIAIARRVGPSVDSHDWVTIGSPRCERPSLRRLQVVNDFGPVGKALPAAIGGQSGSGIFEGENCVGLITWTDGTHTLYQTADALSQSLDADFVGELQKPDCPCSFEQAWTLPDGAVPCCEQPTPCESGYFGPTSGVVQVLALAGESDLFEQDSEADEQPRWLQLMLELLPILLKFFMANGVTPTAINEAVKRCK